MLITSFKFVKACKKFRLCPFEEIVLICVLYVPVSYLKFPLNLVYVNKNISQSLNIILVFHTDVVIKIKKNKHNICTCYESTVVIS